MKTPAHLSCGVAALALLLAACGGGGGNDNGDKAVSASPVAPVNPLAPANSGGGITDSTPPASSPDTPSSALSDNRARGTPNTTTPPVDTGTTPPAAQPQPQPQPQPANPAPTPPTTDGASRGTPTPTTEPVPLVSAQGVRGDVLLTMMDQRPCFHYLHETTSHDGLTVAEETIPALSIYSELTPTNYPAAPVMPYPGYVPSGYKDVTCSSAFYPYQPVAAGSTYEYESTTKLSYNKSCRSESCPRGFHYLSLSIPFIVGKDSVRLGRLMKTDMEEGNIDPSGYDHTKVWHDKARPVANTDFSFKLGEMVPFGIKHAWEGEDQRVQLMVLDAAPAKDTAKLCWNIVSPPREEASVHRLEDPGKLEAWPTARRHRQLHYRRPKQLSQ